MPDQRVTLIALCNTNAGDLDAIAKQLVKLVVQGKPSSDRHEQESNNDK